jgi:hypothetical protein
MGCDRTWLSHSGHHGSDTKRAWMLSALAMFARYEITPVTWLATLELVRVHLLKSGSG